MLVRFLTASSPSLRACLPLMPARIERRDSVVRRMRRRSRGDGRGGAVRSRRGNLFCGVSSPLAPRSAGGGPIGVPPTRPGDVRGESVARLTVIENVTVLGSLLLAHVHEGSGALHLGGLGGGAVPVRLGGSLVLSHDSAHGCRCGCFEKVSGEDCASLNLAWEGCARGSGYRAVRRVRCAARGDVTRRVGTGPRKKYLPAIHSGENPQAENRLRTWAQNPRRARRLFTCADVGA